MVLLSRARGRSLTDCPSDGDRPGKPVNRFFVVKVLELHSLIAGDFGFPEIDCADQKGRKRGREETRKEGLLRAAAGPIHRSHRRRRILPNLRNARKYGGGQ